MDQPAPTIPPTPPGEQSFSQDFATFLSVCVDKEPTNRVSAKDLLNHPWLRLKPLPPMVDEQRSSSSASSRHDRTIGRPELERSRSSLQGELDVSSMLGGMSLGEALQDAMLKDDAGVEG